MFCETQLCEFSQPQPSLVVWHSGMLVPYQLHMPPFVLPPLPPLPVLLPELLPVFVLGATARPVLGSILPAQSPLALRLDANCEMAPLVLL